MQAKFVSDTFSWQKAGLAKVGVKGIGSGGKKHQVLCLEDSHGLQDGGEGAAYRLGGKGGARFPQGQT